MLKREPETRVIVVNRPLMDAKQIESAFAGNAAAPWYLALVQMITEIQRDNVLEASRSASANNTLAMAGAVNVYEALNALLNDLDKAVNQPRAGG